MTERSEKLLFNRDCGILLHPTSLPNAYGVGDFGPSAMWWIDQLRENQQSLWQVLPLNPCGYGNSPYQALSAFAGNPLFLSPEDLHQKGLLSNQDLQSVSQPSTGLVDYLSVSKSKTRILDQIAFNFFALDSGNILHRQYRNFLSSSTDWIEDYALFVTLKSFYGGEPWTNWPDSFRDRDPLSLNRFAHEHSKEINQIYLEQFLLRQQWEQVRQHARASGVRIIGDLPIFVAHDSADVWCRPDLFRLDSKGQPFVVAGVPPDYFSETGQLWGNPLYDWSAHHAEKFSWWRRRVSEVLKWVDIVRIDHFRGFSACWEVSGDSKTAVSGRWVEAPGNELFDCFVEDLGFPLPFIAEDLGVITQDVRNLKERFRLPGIRIEQFAFGNDSEKNTFLPEAYDSNSVAYTGTHDNDTVMGWFQRQEGEACTMSQEEVDSERLEVLAYFGTDGSRLHWDFIRSLYCSNAAAAIIPIQDLLGLGSEARMNIPGTAEGNWDWRLSMANVAICKSAFPELLNLSVISRRGIGTVMHEHSTLK